MPKLGRRSETSEVDYMMRENVTTHMAPFGTMDTPTMHTKIIAGRPVMVAESRWQKPKQPQTIEDLSPPGGSPRRRNRKLYGSVHLEPLTEKPNHFDPTPFTSPRQKHNPTGYISAHPDSHNSHIHPSYRPPGCDSPSINPYRLVPPIIFSEDPLNKNFGPPPGTYGNMPPVPNDITDLLRRLPKDSFLPRQPITFSKKEELELRRRVHIDLKGFDPSRFRDIYIELTGYDRHLTGLVNFQDMGFTFTRSQLNVSALHLRLVAAMFVSPTEPGKVNYEDILAFLASCQRDPDVLSNNSQQREQREEEEAVALDPGMVYNVITLQDDDFRRKNTQNVPHNDPYTVGPQSSKFPYQDRENAKLLRYIEEQLKNADDPVDFEKAWSIFSRADRDKRGTLSRDQIKQLAFTSGIPLQDSLVNQIIDRCDHSNGQYRWEEFLEFVGRVAPKKTGLKIPESKQPKEYVKHYPVPNTDWPRGEWDNSKFGLPRKHTSRGQADLNPRETPRKDTMMAVTPPQATGSPLTGLKTYSPEEPEDPSQMLPSSSWHPRHEALQQMDERARHLAQKDRRQRELETLDRESEGSLQTGRKQDSETEPWFDRFMKMANALYDRATKSGYLPFDDVHWLTQEYNRTFNLRIPENTLKGIVKSYERDGRVNVDLLLKDLGLQGP